MKRYVTFLLLTLSIFPCLGQTLIPKTLKVLNSDTYAQVNQRLDDNGKKCAVIRFDVVGVKDLMFAEAIGDVTYKDNEFIVYIPEGTKKLTFSSDVSPVVFEDYDIEIQSGVTYRLTADTENKLRSAVFYVKPTDATVTVNGQIVKVDNSGKGSIDLPIGKYSYTVEAPEYVPVKDSIMLLEKDFFTIQNLELQKLLYPLTITCNKPNALLFIDNKNYGQIGMVNENIMLSKGSHEVRALMEGYEDYKKSIKIPQKAKELGISLKEMKTQYNVYDNERTKSSISLRSHVDMLFSGHTPGDDFVKSGMGKLQFDYHRYFGYLALKAGLNSGVGYYSSNFVEKKDIDTPVNEDGEDQNTFITLDIPLQLGFALPLNKYNSSQVVVMGGGYASYNFFLGNITNLDELEGLDDVSHFFDYGLRANVILYIKKFVLSFEGNQSLSNNKLGTSVGFGLGIRLFTHKL